MVRFVTLDIWLKWVSSTGLNPVEALKWWTLTVEGLPSEIAWKSLVYPQKSEDGTSVLTEQLLIPKVRFISSYVSKGA